MSQSFSSPQIPKVPKTCFLKLSSLYIVLSFKFQVKNNFLHSVSNLSYLTCHKEYPVGSYLFQNSATPLDLSFSFMKKVLKSNKLKDEGGRASNSFLGGLAGFSSSFFSTFFSAFLGYYLAYFSFLGFQSFLSSLTWTHSFLVTKGYLKKAATASLDKMCLYHLKIAQFPFKKDSSMTVQNKGAIAATKEVSATVNPNPAK